MTNNRLTINAEGTGSHPQSSALMPPKGQPQPFPVIRVTRHVTLEHVLDQLRDSPEAGATLLLDPLSVLFSTPDHFRALDAVRIARRLSVIIEVTDAHRTGLALAFGYRVRQPGNHAGAGTAPVPDLQYGPPNRMGALRTDAPPATPPVVKAPHDRAAPRARRRHAERRVVRVVLLAVCAAMCVLIGAVIVTLRVHTVDVTVRPAEQSFSRVVQFAVSVSPTNDPNALQTTLFETTIAREGDATATGTTTVPDGTASGVVTLRSRADGATSLKAGTALKGPHEVSYLVQSDVVVPGLDFVRGQLGEATAQVRASQPGPSGNLGAGFSARYTDNVTYISGEISGGTEKQVAVVSDADVAAVRARLENELRLRALTEVNAVLPPGTTALNDYLTLRTPAVTVQPPVGTQTDTVHVRVAITGQIPVYQNADFDALIDRRLTEAVRDPGVSDGGARQVLPETVVKGKPVFVDVQGPLVRYFATVTGTTRAILTEADLARVRAALVGRDPRGAQQVLSGEPSLGGHDIRYGPSWLPKILRERMPRTASHIHLHIGT